jgi:tRNA modification GTPase
VYPLEDTICAIATPAGIGGVGIVRLSGPQAFVLAQKVFRGSQCPGQKRGMLFGKFIDPVSKEILDEGLLLVMPGPSSYTGEDVVEFHAHGSPILLLRLVEVLTALNARPAQAGEFTYRGFCHGRLDLTQAEAIESLVFAQGEASRRQALKQLTGGLSSHLEPLEEALKALYIKIEARLEFSEDGIPPLDLEKFRDEVREIRLGLQKLLWSYAKGKVLRDGVVIALVGPPNTGKSSLLNALLGTNRAIVNSVAGTTRDVVEGDIQLKGVKIRFFDTAGIHEAKNEVEAEGIRRSRQVMEEADILFWLVDASDPETSLVEAQKASLPRERTLFLFNKIDLVRDKEPWKKLEKWGLDSRNYFSLSCITKEGLDRIFEKIENFLQIPLAGEDVILTSARHQIEVLKAEQSLNRLEGLIQSNALYELWAEELKEGILAIGRIRGLNLSTAAFEEIFKRFCIGK